MSSTIHFEFVASEVAPGIIALFAQCAQSNVTEVHSKKLARDWSALALGSRTEVLCVGLRLAALCDSGMLKLRGQSVRCETYYAAFERAVRAAKPHAVEVTLCLPHEGPAAWPDALRDALLEAPVTPRFGSHPARLPPLAVWLEAITHLPGVAAWHLIRLTHATP